VATKKFNASVQYGDLKGSAAADRADRGTAEAWLEKSGHKKEGEFLLGVSLVVGENHGQHKDPVYVEFLLTTPGDFDSVRAMIDAAKGPIEVRSVKLQVPIAEFLGLFKRFSVDLSPGGMLDGREYHYKE
jgi:hypothetical protein